MSTLTITALVEEYLAFRRKLGFTLKSEGRELRSFARYAEQTGHKGGITAELAVRWAQLPATADRIYWARRLGIITRLARHLLASDPSTEVPDPGFLGSSHRRREPHIYSEAELTELLRAAARLWPSSGLRPKTYTTLFGLLASTGLRIAEALRLTRDEVDLDTGVLTVTETKFHKSRLVPLHATTTTALRCYAEHRDRFCPLPRASTFFLSDTGIPVKYRRVNDAIVKLRRGLGWTADDGRRLPTIHDLRHTFACRRLLGWYEEGADVNLKMPALSTYLGHVRVSDTYWYLSAIPELMARAAARFERAAGGGQ
jgi:integrase